MIKILYIALVEMLIKRPTGESSYHVYLHNRIATATVVHSDWRGAELCVCVCVCVCVCAHARAHAYAFPRDFPSGHVRQCHYVGQWNISRAIAI